MRYLRTMRWLVSVITLVFIFAGCEDEYDGCPEIWTLDKRQISAYAKIDSNKLVLEVWNPTSPNAIELGQEFLRGDFEVSIQLKELQWDTLVNPQFRFEVYDISNPSESLCGVAVQPNIYYCYVGGTDSQHRDNRLINSATGELKVSRINGVVSSFADIDGVVLTYADTFHNNDMGVRLVLGATEIGAGLAKSVLSDFIASSDWPYSQTQASPIQWDDFGCESW